MSNAPLRSRQLTERECMTLLSSVSLGRVVFTKDALPAIRPVNHIVDRDSIVIRSHLGAAIVAHAGTADGAIVAYEADDLDPVTHVGWSVIVTGTARLVRDPAATTRYSETLRPWIAGTMDHVISIKPEIITGIYLLEEHATANGSSGA